MLSEKKTLGTLLYIPIYALMITYLSNLIFFYKFFRKWSVKNKLHFINWGNMLYIFCKHACSIIYTIPKSSLWKFIYRQYFRLWSYIMYSIQKFNYGFLLRMMIYFWHCLSMDLDGKKTSHFQFTSPSVWGIHRILKQK